MKSIFIIRHGETKWNAENIYQGQSNSPLTKNGIETAKKIANSLKGKDIKYIYSSPLKRTQETSRIIADVLGAEIILVPEFEEMHFGILEGRIMDEAEKEHKEFFIRRAADVLYKIATPFPKGESYLDLHKRVKDVVPTLITNQDNFIIVGHQSINRIIRAIILDIPLEFAVVWRQKNHEYFEIDLESKKEYTHLIK